MASLDIIFPVDTGFSKGLIQKSFDYVQQLDGNVNCIVVYKDKDDIKDLKITKARTTLLNKNFSNYYQAFNRGISIAKSDYLMFLVPGNFLNNCVSSVIKEANNEDLITTYYSSIKNGVEVYLNKKEVFDKPNTYKVENCIPKGMYDSFNKLYKRTTVTENQIMFNDKFVEAEFVFNLNFLSHSTNFKVVNNNMVIHSVPDVNVLSADIKSQQSNLLVKEFSGLENVAQGELKNYIKKHKSNLKQFLFYGNIDLVFPYVTSDDTVWQEAYKDALIKNGADENSWQAGIERFRDSGTLKYFFRSLDVFCPWIHQVHMIVMSESQVPKWLNTKYVHIITHDQFMPKEMLPTFNSSTIEMFLHNLPDVANTFVYANDDMLFTRPIEPTFFFDGGKPIYQVILRNFRNNAPGDKMRLNDYNLYFGTDQTKRVVNTQHGPIAFKKAWLAECYKRFEKEMLASCTPFRTETDLNQYLYALYQMMEKEIVNTQREYRVYNVSSYYMPKILSEDFSNVDAICINDSNSSTPEQWEQVIEKLDKLLPDKCKYEL